MRNAAVFRSALTLAGLALTLAISAWLELGALTPEPAKADAESNLAMAFNVAKHGIYSNAGSTSNLSPTMRREPLPNLVLAAWMFVSTPVSIADTYSDLNRGAHIQRLKLINILWASGVTALAFLIVFTLTGSGIFSLLAAAAQLPVLLSNPSVIDQLMTELPAACMILGSCYLTVLSVQRGNISLALGAGILTGAAALIKAVIFYILLPLALGLAILLYLRKRSAMKGLILAVVFLLGSIIVTGPWIARNAFVFGEPRLTTRAGLILYKRMLLDNMTTEEYRGSFYAWAPSEVRHLFEHAFGYKPSDLEPGGALQRLNRKLRLPEDRIAQQEGRPELASNYYSMMRAERRRQYNAFGGQEYSLNAAEQAMETEAKSWILSHPLDHLALMVPLAWRGMWVSRVPVTWAPILLLSLLAAPWMGLAARRWDLVAFSLLPVAIFAISTGATHNIPRYTIPIVPAMVISATVLGWLIWSTETIQRIITLPLTSLRNTSSRRRIVAPEEKI